VDSELTETERAQRCQLKLPVKASYLVDNSNCFGMLFVWQASSGSAVFADSSNSSN
jgi:hypothetical protein